MGEGARRGFGRQGQQCRIAAQFHCIQVDSLEGGPMIGKIVFRFHGTQVAVGLSAGTEVER